MLSFNNFDMFMYVNHISCVIIKKWKVNNRATNKIHYHNMLLYAERKKDH